MSVCLGLGTPGSTTGECNECGREHSIVMKCAELSKLIEHPSPKSLKSRRVQLVFWMLIRLFPSCVTWPSLSQNRISTEFLRRPWPPSWQQNEQSTLADNWSMAILMCVLPFPSWKDSRKILTWDSSHYLPPQLHMALVGNEEDLGTRAVDVCGNKT